MSPKSTFKDGAWHGQIGNDVSSQENAATSQTSQPIQFPPEKGRYHLYIGLFCPFAHRANLIRHLKGLIEILPLSIVKPYPKGDSKGRPGWKFPTDSDPYEGSTPDHLFGSTYLNEIYFKEKPDYEGRYSVPLLWDKVNDQLVNNESLEILRNFNTGFNSILPIEYASKDFYPPHLQTQIDEIGSWMQSDLNFGVYKAGFAPSQEIYDQNVISVFKALNRLEILISKNGRPYILGSELTELDLRLFPTLIRFDVVYVQHFKCNLGTIRHDYPVLNQWMKNLYWNVEGFRETTDFRHIKENYTKSHPDINPKAITPLGPIPHIESGVETDWSNIRVGGVELPV